MNEFCLAIRNFTRVNYLSQSLKSLEANDDLEEIDFWLFQDGIRNPYTKVTYGNNSEIDKSISLFYDSKLPNKRVYKQYYNRGASLQRGDQFKILLSRYRYVMLVDNDLVYNKYYLRSMKTLFRQFEEDDRAGMLQLSLLCFNKNLQPYKEAKENEGKVAYGFGWRFEAGFWQNKWDKIREQIQPYFEISEKVDYNRLVHRRQTYVEERKKLVDLYGTYRVDEAIEKAVGMAGYNGLHTKSLRYHTIGEKGFYSTKLVRGIHKKSFSKVKVYSLGKVDKYELDED